MFRRALALTLALSILGCATASAAEAPTTRQDRDPLAALGAGSPSCRSTTDARAKQNCDVSGSIAHRYPLDSYGIDVQVGFSVTDMGDSFLGALQSIGAMLWMALVLLIKAVLLLLEWAFSLDLLGEAMSDVRRTLAILHERVIGQPWFLTAIAVTGIWGIWRGLVQRRTSETIVGLAATVGLMLCGLVVLADPEGTVGHASKLANDASISVLAAATGEDTDRPDHALPAAMAGVFDRVIRDPWCALEFGSVDYCHAHARGTRTTTNADVWLAYPAGSSERKALYNLLKGDPPGGNHSLLDSATRPLRNAVGIGGGDPPSVPDDVRAKVAKAPERAALQGADGTFTRFALLALVTLGVLGAAALLGYIGIRLLLAGVLSLLLLLVTPAILLAPAFGESGRATFIAWVRRLANALLAKLIYALLLAIVLAGAAALARMDIGWFGSWLLQITFWWGVLLKRSELLGFVSAGATEDRGTSLGQALSKLYYGAALGRIGSRGVHRATRPPARAASALKHEGVDRAQAREAAIRELAEEQLGADARHALGRDHERAEQRVALRPELEREARAVDRKLAGYDETSAAARAQGHAAPAPTAEESALLRHRTQLRERLGAPELREAEHIVSHRARAAAQGRDAVGERDVAEYRERRRRQLASDPSPDHPDNARAAGIDPRELRDAEADRQAELRRQVQAHVEREQQLLAPSPKTDGARGPQALFDPDEIRARSREHHARLRRERRERRARANVFHRR